MKALWSYILLSLCSPWLAGFICEKNCCFCWLRIRVVPALTFISNKGNFYVHRSVSFMAKTTRETQVFKFPRGKILYVKCYSRLLCKSWFLCKIKCSQWHNTILPSQFHLFPCTEACVWFLTALTFSQIQPQRLLSITAVVIFHLLEILKGRIGHVQRLPAEKHHFTGI